MLLHPPAEGALMPRLPTASLGGCNSERRAGLLGIALTLVLPLVGACFTGCSQVPPLPACIGPSDALTYNMSGPREINSGLICP